MRIVAGITKLPGKVPGTAALSTVTKLPGQVLNRVGIEGLSAVALVRAGAFGVESPTRLLKTLLAFEAYGPAGAALEIACQRHPTRTAIIDERGSLSFRELDDRSGRLANALRARWAEEDSSSEPSHDGDSGGDEAGGDAAGRGSNREAALGIGILCRNHRGLFEALFAAAKLGARTVLLNTDFAGPQLAEVCKRENVGLLIHDEEFTAIAAGCSPRYGTVVAWQDAVGQPATADSIDGLISATDAASVRWPRRTQRIVLLTSGTTGSPKGAARDFGTSLAIPGGLLSKIPLRSQENVLIAVPAFHAWGLLSAVVALALADTVILRRTADSAAVADDLQRYGCDTLVTVPILLSRLLAELQRQPRQLDALRVVAVSGSALSPELAARTRVVLGNVLHNLYGSTEVAYAAIATPADLAAAPGSVGTPPFGTKVRILDADGAELPAGQTGRIFVGSTLQFGGYTGGGSKEQIAGLMATGDLGHLDSDGRLWIDGRDDEMIVSGGENVFPGEVEDVLLGHESIHEAAVIGVPDPDFGQRLRAYVVTEAGVQLTADDVRDYVKSQLARYKVPRDVRFVDTLPRNPAGKIVKRELAHD